MGVVLFHLPLQLDMLIGWLSMFVLVALFLAAFLHWRLVRHWSLLLLAVAPLCFVLWYVSFRIGEMPLRGARLDEIASGSRVAIQPLITLSSWLALVGVACAGIGAVGSVCRALTLGRQTRSGTQNGVAGPTPPAH